MNISRFRRVVVITIAAVVVAVLPFAPKAAAATADADTSPFLGGSTIGAPGQVPSSGPFCTSGFPWFQFSGNGYGLLSAGHCYPQTNVPVSTAAQKIGDVSVSSWDVSSGSIPVNGALHGDFSLISVDAPQGAAPRIYRRPTSGTIAVNVQSTWGRPAQIGDQYCTDGWKTGELCGWVVKDVHQEFDWDDGVHKAFYLVRGEKNSGNCTQGGDSGGPVYTVLSSGDVVAKGIHEGSDLSRTTGSVLFPCEEWFTDIFDVIAAMPNGHPLTIDNPAPPTWHYGSDWPTQIKNQGSARCLVTSGNQSGNTAWMAACYPRYADQVWTTYALGNGLARIVNNNSGLCLAAPYWTNYTPAQVGCADYADQEWIIDITTAGTRIRIDSTQNCLIGPSQPDGIPYMGSCDGNVYGYWMQM